MIRQLLIIFFAALPGISCSNKAGSTNIHIVHRDTSITKLTAYTQLLLDSVKLASFIKAENILPGDAESFINFYHRRNYQYAWFDEQGLTQQGEAFWSLHQSNAEERKDTVASAIFLHRYMTELLNEAAVVTGDTLSMIEMLLTRHFFGYIKKSFQGKVEPDEMQWYIPRRKINNLSMLDSFLTGNSRTWRPLNNDFYKLDSALAVLIQQSKNGAWPKIELINTKVIKGSTDNIIRAIKRRLAASGDYNAGDTGRLLNAGIEKAIKRMQLIYGLAETGIPDNQLISRLNITIEERIKQLSINLERMRWMPGDSPDRLLVNIPEFKLHVYDGMNEAMVMNIVVGKAATHTVIFSDMLKYVIFSPYWNVPESIVANEILPSIARSRNYLERHNMEVVKRVNGLPVIRQRPGGANALGKVKFLFPNRYNIYLHDTPSKTLFNSNQRAFSHGCIRVHRPFELAKFLLQDQAVWTDDKINAAMNKSKEEWVLIRKPRPVYVVYFTAWVDKNGILNLRDDIYGHDQRMAQHLFN